MKINHWTSNQISLLAIWLWFEKEYGHSLLLLLGTAWGLKMNILLNLKWVDVLNRHNILTSDIKYIPVTQFAKRFINDAYKQLKIKNINEYVFLNYKTNKRLTTSTLNREIYKLTNKFLNAKEHITIDELKRKHQLKTGTLEIA